MTKKLIYSLILILLLGLLFGLSKQIRESLIIGERLNKEAEELVALQQKNNQLKEKLKQSQQAEYIEEIARNKLNFSRLDEAVVVIPESEIERVLSANTSNQQAGEPYWRGWLRLFF